MHSNEINTAMKSNDFRKMSTMFLELRKLSWKEVGSDSEKNQLSGIDELRNNYQSELKIFLDNNQQDLFCTEQGCLMAKFVELFGYEYLEKDRIDFIKQGLEKNKEKYPILKEIDNTTNVLKKNLFNFFVSYGDDYDKQSDSFSLDKTNNQLANLIVETEIKRTITDFSDRPKLQNNKNNFSIVLGELDNQFEIILKK